MQGSLHSQVCGVPTVPVWIVHGSIDRKSRVIHATFFRNFPVVDGLAPLQKSNIGASITLLLSLEVSCDGFDLYRIHEVCELRSVWSKTS